MNNQPNRSQSRIIIRQKLINKIFDIPQVEFQTGTWVTELDKDELINVKIDKAKKISAYVFLRALGFNDREIFDKPKPIIFSKRATKQKTFLTMMYF